MVPPSPAVAWRVNLLCGGFGAGAGALVTATVIEWLRDAPTDADGDADGGSGSGGKASVRSAVGLGSPCHVCAGTGLTPATSCTGTGRPLPPCARVRDKAAPSSRPSPDPARLGRREA